MKSITHILAITFFSLLPVTLHAQGTPKENTAGPAEAGKRTDLEHVHFTKAALGKPLS